MKALVTGAAGFIGSNLVDALLADGHDVVGIDSFSPYYRRDIKLSNIRSAMKHARFNLVEADLRTDSIADALDGVDVVFHQAGQPGVRLSWSDGFDEYDSCNVLATQRLLEAIKEQKERGGSTVSRVVYASSSSLYGNAPEFPTRETDLPHPHSPYAVTKLAGEHLCGLYASNWQLPTVSLRYFTVFGPRQRPDMAMFRLVAAALGGPPFPLYGDGHHVRDFTFVGDVVAANLLAATKPLAPGTVMNIAGGGSTVMSELIDLVGDLTGTSVPVERLEPRAGDVERTGGSIDVAHERLGWKPMVSVEEGLRAQIEWHRRRHSGASD